MTPHFLVRPRPRLRVHRRWQLLVFSLTLWLWGGCAIEKPTSNPKLKRWGNVQLLQKAHRAISGEQPSYASVTHVKNGNNATLTAEINALLESEAFYTWVEDVYADVLRTRSFVEYYEGGKNTLLAHFNEKLFPIGQLVRYAKSNMSELNSVIQWMGLPDPEFLTHTIEKAGDYLAEEPLKLISYVVRNNMPFSEILSTHYTVLNPHVAFLYGVDVAKNFSNYTDETDWKPFILKKHRKAMNTPDEFGSYWWLVDNGKVQHAGILSTTAFLARYPSSGPNFHRTRAAFLLKHFLNFDVLTDVGLEQVVSLDELESPEAVKAPACNGCHAYLDPVAQAWNNYPQNVYVKPKAPDPWTTDFPEYQSMKPPGVKTFSYDENTPFSQAETRLRWLGDEIPQVAGGYANQTFAHAVTHTVFDALMGANSREEIASQSSADKALDTFISSTANSFKNSNYNFKLLVRTILLSDYFAGCRIEGYSIAQDQHRYHGSARLLSPEKLANKIRQQFAGTLSESSLNYVLKDLEDPQSLGLAYGGTTYGGLNRRNSEMNPFMANIQLKLAADLACKVIQEEFSKAMFARHIFVLNELDTELPATMEDPDYINMGIAVNTAYAKIGVPRAWTEVGNLEALWKQTKEAASKWSIPYQCRPTTNVSPKNALKWMAVLTYVFSDYYAFHE